MANILITGGTGLIGTSLTKLFIRNGHDVAHLSRSDHSREAIKKFSWEPERKVIDPLAIPWADHIIHLAGESVGQRWTKEKKRRILESRLSSTQLIVQELAKRKALLKSFVSASAVGYYGDDTGDDVLSESSDKGDGFLSDVVELWEEAVDESKGYVDRVVKIRIGVVFAKDGGALGKMAMPIKWGVGSILGSGNQWLSWIHILDLSKIFISAVENNMEGVYNGVTPNPVTNRELTRQLAKKLKRPLFLPPVPKFVLKLLLGEMSVLVLGSNKAMPIAFQKEGFTFEYATLSEALKSLV